MRLEKSISLSPTKIKTVTPRLIEVVFRIKMQIVGGVLVLNPSKIKKKNRKIYLKFHKISENASISPKWFWLWISTKLWFLQEERSNPLIKIFRS